MPLRGKINNVGKIQIKVAKTNLLNEILPIIVPILAYWE